jgi:hypothetical protein
MNLSPHFTLEEAVLSQTAARNGIDNTPSDDIITNMRAAAAQLEQVRAILGYPIAVSSWYRCPQVNALVGGATNSAHMSGWAIDFNCTEYGSLVQVVTAVSTCGVPYDQVIFEFDSWCHISFDPAMRGQVLTIRHGTGYMNGIIPR